jgi:hypothetical protein
MVKVISFVSHYKAMGLAMNAARKNCRDTMWYLDHCNSEAEEDEAIANAEKADKALDILREEKSRLSALVVNAEKKHRIKYNGNVRFEMESQMYLLQIAISRKVVEILNY